MAFGVAVISCATPVRQAVFFDRERVMNMGTLAVLPLENMSDSPAATQAVADMLAASLDRSARFRLVRQDALTVRPIDRIAAREIGRGMGVDGVLYGTITEFGSPVTAGNKKEAVFGLQLRLLDVRTGIIVWSSMVYRTSEESLFSNALSASDLALASTSEIVAELALGADLNRDSGDGME